MADDSTVDLQQLKRCAALLHSIGALTSAHPVPSERLPERYIGLSRKLVARAANEIHARGDDEGPSIRDMISANYARWNFPGWLDTVSVEERFKCENM